MLELNGGTGLDRLVKMLADYSSFLVLAAAALSIVMLVQRLRRSDDGHTLGSRLAGRISQAFTTNWQLTLLATTAFVLSLASGWTTWDGMRHFTGEPLLSFMITFGIQGVMLIIAWLIGESFAAGVGGGRRAKQAEWTVGSIVGVLAFLGLAAVVSTNSGLFGWMSLSGSQSWTAFADKALYVALGLLLLTALLINNRSDVIAPYMQSIRVMAKNAVLWVMFLACMATSVFFSFDSLFSSIFPQSERKRAADIRAERQVAGVVADIGALARRRQIDEAEALFKSEGWKAYERNLTALSQASQGAERLIEAYFVSQMEHRRAAIAQQQERISSALSGQAGLVSRKNRLTDELSRLKGDRPALAADLAGKKSELDNRAKGVDAKRVEMMAEERGAEGSLKVGRGPMYRQRKDELDQLQAAYKIQQQRVKDAQERLTEADTRIAGIGRELAEVDADIANLKGETETARQRITIAQATKTGEEGNSTRVDPARVRVAFERAQSEFHREPTARHLDDLAQQCSQLLGAMLSTPATKDKVREIDCDPKSAQEAAGRVFALNEGIISFEQRCAGGDKLPLSKGTDALLSFGRKCLQDSGLPSHDSAEMAARISAIDLNRDDKAHRFVVTWNAFADGNRLAYLALAIAIAIDSLVFMSGLFGANAVRSPLTEIGDRGEMTADQLEATIDATLGETAHPRATLSALLSSLHPIHGQDGFTAEILLDEREPLIDEMRQVLVAGAVIGAVRPVGSGRGHYLVHSGLARYLAIAQRKPWVVKPGEVDKKELVNVIGVALYPDPPANAEIVLGHLHPISDSERFSAETYPFDNRIPGDDRRLVLKTLGAGATIPGTVARENENGRYLVSTQFYKTLLMIRAGAIPAFRYAAQRPVLQAGPANVQALRAESDTTPQLELDAHQVRELPDHTAYNKPKADGDLPAPARPRTGMSADRQAGTPAASRSSVPTPLGSGIAPPPLPPNVHPANDASEAGPSAAQPPAPSSQLATQIKAEIKAQTEHTWAEFDIEHAARSDDADGLEEALEGLISRGGLLSERINAELNHWHESFATASQELRRAHANDRAYLQVLESEIEKLDRALPGLLTTADGRYESVVQELLRELKARADTLANQSGSGGLSEAEHHALENLTAHLYGLREIRAKDAERGRRIIALLDRYDERGTGTAWSASDMPRRHGWRPES
ncbi:MAG: hypothetical protein ACK5JT_21625 [Hyphomicrobiaceae bacterium]